MSENLLLSGEKDHFLKKIPVKMNEWMFDKMLGKMNKKVYSISRFQN